MVDVKKAVGAKLQASLVNHVLVQLERAIPGASLPWGYIVSMGTKWVLLQVVDDGIYLDGYAAVRTRDITKVRRSKSGEFVKAALILKGQWPPMPPAVALDVSTTRGLLTSVASLVPLTTVFLERREADACYIGTQQTVQGRWCELTLVTPRATWLNGARRYRLRDLTRVDFAGGYENALWAVGRQDLPPARKPPTGQ